MCFETFQLPLISFSFSYFRLHPYPCGTKPFHPRYYEARLLIDIMCFSHELCKLCAVRPILHPRRLRFLESDKQQTQESKIRPSGS